jgi:GxxExxY protein
MAEVIYPELSFKLVGLAYDVFNNLGYGLQEKSYQNAYEQGLINCKYKYEREKMIELFYGGKKVGKYFLDFLVDNSIIVELKVAPFVEHVPVKQVREYLKLCNKHLAIVLYFTQEGVKVFRILNSSYSINSLA